MFKLADGLEEEAKRQLDVMKQKGKRFRRFQYHEAWFMISDRGNLEGYLGTFENGEKYYLYKTSAPESGDEDT